MSISDHSRFDDLMSRYLDASLDDAEEHELLQSLSDENLASRFHELTQLDTGIAGLLAGSIPDEVMVGLVWSDLAGSEALSSSQVAAEPIEAAILVPVFVRRRPNNRRRALLALAAVLAGVVGVAALAFFRAPTLAAGGKIAAVRGEVYLVGPSGRVPLGEGRSLEGGGTIKTVGPDSQATLALTDGTEITLLGNTSFNVGPAAGKRHLFLEAGTLRSKVVRQPENAPLVFAMADATATVRGTELAIIEGNSGTYLVVLHGAVALRRSSGGPEVFINAGYYGHVEPRGEFRPWPIGRLPKALREQLNIQD